MLKHIAILQKVPLFSELEQDIEKILPCLNATVKQYGGHSAILLAGDAVDKIGIVLTGLVRIVKEDEEGRATIMTELSEGELFGEALACAEVKESLVTVETVITSEILFLDYRKITTVCHSACVFHSKIMQNLLRMIAKKNIMLNQKIEVLSKRTIRDKILTYLDIQKKIAGHRQIEIGYNRTELADFLCVDRSALSRELGKLRDEGVLDFEKNKFILK